MEERTVAPRVCAMCRRWTNLVEVYGSCPVTRHGEEWHEVHREDDEACEHFERREAQP